jgi:hypothetical protein
MLAILTAVTRLLGSTVSDKFSDVLQFETQHSKQPFNSVVWQSQQTYSFDGSSKIMRLKRLAAIAPVSCAMMNIGTSAGAIPEKLLVKLRAIVIAGLAKLGDDVNQ